MKNMHLYCDEKDHRLRRSIMEELSKKNCYFEALFEIVDNFRQENWRLPPSQHRKMKEYIYILDKIYEKPKNKRSRKKLIKQSGGFWPLILPILTSVVTELISDAFSKKSNPDSS